MTSSTNVPTWEQLLASRLETLMVALLPNPVITGNSVSGVAVVLLPLQMMAMSEGVVVTAKRALLRKILIRLTWSQVGFQALLFPRKVFRKIRLGGRGKRIIWCIHLIQIGPLRSDILAQYCARTKKKLHLLLKFQTTEL